MPIPVTQESIAPATSAEYQPTSLFSLPLELRQMIYDLCIPVSNGILNVTDWQEQTVLALKASHPLIALEVRRRDQRKSSILRIIVSPRSASMPALLVPNPAFGGIQEVQFIFSRIDLCKEVHCAHTRNAIIHQQITSMITTTRKYVGWVARTFDDYALQHLSIRFCGHFDGIDSCWASTSLDGNVLTTTNQQPIYEALLAPLLKLPIVRECQISTLHHVSSTHATLWNYDFMIDFHWAAVSWLSGSKDKALNFYVHFLRQWIWTRPGVQYMLPESWYQDRLGMNREQALRLVDVNVYGSDDSELARIGA